MNGLPFIGSCDRVRRTPEGEAFFQAMMATRWEIDADEFVQACAVAEMLDEGETLEEWCEYHADQGSPVRFFRSACGTFHAQTEGLGSGAWEFIFSRR
jgi:hypothetical protein